MSEAKKTINKRPNLEAMRLRDRKLVRGRFNFHDCPGGMLKFTTHFYKGNPPEDWTMVDGQIYSIPLEVARHLNKNVAYPEHEYLPGYEKVLGAVPADGGNNIPMRIKRMVRRTSFESLDFLEEEDLKPNVSAIDQVQVPSLAV